ncbi:MAG TPA: hypothetical protein VJV79_40445 [Polyangiaceae bacterium]|nr:hypothetical protein [Polyangiaceae bacterium]
MEPIKTSFTSGAVTIHIEGKADDVKLCLSDELVATHLVKALSAAGQEDKGPEATETLETGLEHAWEWFALHADHRMRSVNFFLVSVAFLSAAYVTALRFSHPIVAAGICIAGLFLTLCFSRLERRIRELVKAGEKALQPLQAKLSENAGIPDLRIVETVEQSEHCFVKYSIVINTLHAVVAIMFVGGLFVAIATHQDWLAPWATTQIQQ